MCIENKLDKISNRLKRKHEGHETWDVENKRWKKNKEKSGAIG